MSRESSFFFPASSAAKMIEASSFSLRQERVVMVLAMLVVLVPLLVQNSVFDRWVFVKGTVQSYSLLQA